MSRRRAITKEFVLEHPAVVYSRPFTSWARVFAVFVTIVLLPPFVMLAVAPMLLFMVPVALCGIPFVVSAFMGQAKEVTAPPRRVARPALRPVTAH